MNQTKLKDFLFTKLVNGYSVEFADFTQQDMEYLQEIAGQVCDDHREDIKPLFDIMSNYVTLAKTKDDFFYIWEGFWDVSSKIGDIISVDWCDPDTSYEEDIMARYNAIKNYLED